MTTEAESPTSTLGCDQKSVDQNRPNQTGDIFQNIGPWINWHGYMLLAAKNKTSLLRILLILKFFKVSVVDFLKIKSLHCNCIVLKIN
jgi:hypothetical protein